MRIIAIIGIFLLFMCVGLLGRISATLEDIREERMLRVTEIINHNTNQYDVSAYGTVVLPDNGLIE